MRTPPPAHFRRTYRRAGRGRQASVGTTFDAIFEPLMIVDDDFVVRRANLALADDLSTAIQRLVGPALLRDPPASLPRAFAGQAGQPCAGCPVTGGAQGGRRVEGEMQHRRRDGSTACGPIRFEDEAGKRLTVCSYRDVTDEREMYAPAGQRREAGRRSAGWRRAWPTRSTTRWAASWPSPRS